VLSDSEQRVWDDVQRFWAEEAEEPARPEPGVAAAWGVVGVRIAIVLVLLGAPSAGLTVAIAVVLGWAVSRRRRPSSGTGDVYSLPEAGTPVPGPATARRAVEWGPPFVRRLDEA
jgi:hypothetical protein